MEQWEAYEKEAMQWCKDEDIDPHDTLLYNDGTHLRKCQRWIIYARKLQEHAKMHKYLEGIPARITHGAPLPDPPLIEDIEILDPPRPDLKDVKEFMDFTTNLKDKMQRDMEGLRIKMTLGDYLGHAQGCCGPKAIAWVLAQIASNSMGALGVVSAPDSQMRELLLTMG